MAQTIQFHFLSDTIAFHVVLTSNTTNPLVIPDQSAIRFNRILLNEGDGYVIIFKYYRLKLEVVVKDQIRSTLKCMLSNKVIYLQQI